MQYNTIIDQFQKMVQKQKIKCKDELVIMGSLIGESYRKELLNVSINELENILEFIDKLDAYSSLNVLGCFFQWLFLPIACWLGCFFQSPAGFSQFFFSHFYFVSAQEST